MTCSACSGAITSALEGTNGVLEVSIGLMTERGLIIHDGKIITVDQVKEAIEDCGFDAELIDSEVAEIHDPASVNGSEMVDDNKSYDQQTETQEQQQTKSTTLKIFGMTCSACSNTVENALNSLDGVESAVVGLAIEEALITYDSSKIGIRDMVSAVEDTGFEVVLKSATDDKVQIESLERTKDIKLWKRRVISSAMLSIPVFIIGHILPMCSVNFIAWEIFPSIFFGDLLSLFLTSIVQFHVGGHFYKSAYKALKHGSATMDLLVSISTLSAYSFSVVSIIYGALKHYTMPPRVLFDTSALLITFITIGKYLENIAKGQVSSALSRLIQLAPSQCTIFTNYNEDIPQSNNNNTKVLSTDLAQVNDIILLLPGSKVPADGYVIYGESYIDESLLTGESKPVQKVKKDNVYGGTVNGSGVLHVKLTKVGTDTQLHKIIKLVNDAQTTKAPIQHFADYIASFFVYGIIILGVLTFFVWSILSSVLNPPPPIFEGTDSNFFICLQLGISVVAVACPCALGLATPTAVMVGTGVGAQQGILIKGGAVLEKANKITCFLFDKTGTLTRGVMSVINQEISIKSGLNLNENDLWVLLGSLESQSDHPIAKAIIKHSRDELGLINDNDNFISTVENVVNIPGGGISADIQLSSNNQTFSVLAGNLEVMKSNNVSMGSDYLSLPQLTQTSSNSNSNPKSSDNIDATIIYLAVNNQYIGKLYLADEIRVDSRSTILNLRRLGYKVMMITGDSKRVASSVASQIGISPHMIISNITPSGKQKIVSDLEAGIWRNSRINPQVVCFVGDGINDSPALATASIGMAVGSGTDIAMAASDIVLAKPDFVLADIVTAVLLSQATFKRIKLNFLWAIVYNVCVLPIAMGILLPWGIVLPPSAAGAAMALSSVSVVASSLWLKRWKKPVLVKNTNSNNSEQENLSMNPCHSNLSSFSLLDDLETGKLSNVSTSSPSSPSSPSSSSTNRTYKNSEDYSNIKNNDFDDFEIDDDNSNDSDNLISEFGIEDPLNGSKRPKGTARSGILGLWDKISNKSKDPHYYQPI